MSRLFNTPTRLFNAQAANANSQAFPSAGDYITLIASGTFGGGTITVQVSPDNGTTWISTSATLTAAGVTNFIGGEGLLFRLALTGATNPSISAWVAFQD